MSTGTKLAGPYCFQDNTDYSNGWPLPTQADVLTFFRRNNNLLDPEEWGNAYQAELTDDNGTQCWVEQGPRGGLKVAACSNE